MRGEKKEDYIRERGRRKVSSGKKKKKMEKNGRGERAISQ